MAVLAMSQLLVTAVLARFLTPADFGIVAAANIVITLVQMFAEGGMGAGIVQRRDLTPAFVTASFTLAIGVALVSYIALLILAGPYERIVGIEGSAQVMSALGITFFLYGVGGVCEGLLQRELGFRLLFRINVASSIVGYALPAIILAFAGIGVWAIVVATIMRLAARLAMLYYCVRREVIWQWDSRSLSEVAHFGFGLSHDRLWNWVTAQAPPFLIGQQLGSDALGKFYLGNQLAVLPSQHASTVISTVFLPIMSRARDDKDIIARIYPALLGTAFALLSVVGLFLAMNAELIVVIALGPGWDDAIPVFQILCVAAGVRSGIQISDALNIATGRVYALANRRAVVAILLVVLMLYAISRGLPEVATVIIASQVLMMILTAGMAFGHLRGVNRDGPGVLQPFIASVVLVVAVNAMIWVAFRLDLITAMGQALASVVGVFALVASIIYLFRDCLRVLVAQSGRRVSGAAGAK